MTPQKLPFEKFREIYSQVPRLCVEVMIKTENGVVLTKRAIEPYKGMWHVPGGTVLFGETMEEAVVRVAREEVEVKVKIIKLLGPIYYPNEAIVRGFGWGIGMAYLVAADETKLPEKNEMGEEIKVFALMPENMILEHKEFIEKNIL